VRYGLGFDPVESTTMGRHDPSRGSRAHDLGPDVSSTDVFVGRTASAAAIESGRGALVAGVAIDSIRGHTAVATYNL
jgi:hypothetical protein